VVGDTALVAAAASTILGELIGPVALKRALTRAGEISEAPDSSPQTETAR
jgi:hypothetical protein